MQVALLHHFQQHDFSFLLTVPLEDLEGEISALQKPAKQQLLHLLDLPQRSSQAVTCLQEGQRLVADWKLAVRLTRDLAFSTGHNAGQEGRHVCTLALQASAVFSQQQLPTDNTVY